VAIEDPEHRLWRINHIAKQLVLHPGSLESYPVLYRLVNTIKPDEIYHLAAQSFVSYSFEDEFSILNTNLNGTHNLLSVVRDSAANARFYFAGSSEMFGDADETPQNEGTRFHPRSVYGVSKVAGFHLTRNYREAFGLHASAGILFNHDSPRRGFEFVTRKITSHAAKIKLGLASELRLGNLEARRDWGHAREYVEAMWMMLQQDRPDDYCVATGESHSVREFLEAAFEYVGLDYSQYVVLDPILHRPAEVNVLRGDCSKARERLGWRHSTNLVSLVHGMVDADLEYAERGALNKRMSAR
jgi:GDPmannose 4,6-dehydratase